MLEEDSLHPIIDNNEFSATHISTQQDPLTLNLLINDSLPCPNPSAYLYFLTESLNCYCAHPCLCPIFTDNNNPPPTCSPPPKPYLLHIPGSLPSPSHIGIVLPPTSNLQSSSLGPLLIKVLMSKNILHVYTVQLYPFSLNSPQPLNSPSQPNPYLLTCTIPP